MDIAMMDHTNALPESYKTMVMSLLNFAGEALHLQSDTEMSVTFVDNDEIQQINRQYRDKDMPTDVISFAIEDEGEDELAIIFDDDMMLPRNIGDIFISLERTKEQAERFGHSFERELGFLAVHGFLHLNGYDHMEPEEEKEMFDLQRKILDDYGLQR